MARFLFAATPATGHVNPALPIVSALVKRGHDVVFTTGQSFEAAVTAAGARFVPLPADLDEPMRRVPPDRERLSGVRAVRFDVVHLFTAPAAAQAQHVLSVHRASPADVLVVDTGFVGARLAAELGGPPVAYYGITVFPFSSRDVAPFGSALAPRADPLGRLRNQALGAVLRQVIAGPGTAELNRQRAAVGLPPRRKNVFDWDAAAALYLQLSPAAFEYPRSDLPSVVHFVGSPQLPAAADWTPPSWWAELTNAGRPLVVITQGTVATDPAMLLRPALAGLADEQVVVVATTGGGDVAALEPVPDNARVSEFVPFGELFRHASAVVTNGGYGTVQLALAAGLPLVVAGKTEDKAEVAARVAWSGTGLNLRTHRPSPQQVREAVRRVLTDSSYAGRARELHASAPAADAAYRAVDLLERVAATGGPVRRGELAGMGASPGRH